MRSPVGSVRTPCSNASAMGQVDGHGAQNRATAMSEREAIKVMITF